MRIDLIEFPCRLLVLTDIAKKNLPSSYTNADDSCFSHDTSAKAIPYAERIPEYLRAKRN